MRSIACVVLTVAAGFVALSPGRADAQKRSRDLIKREEIVASIREDQDLYTAIQRLRPHFVEAKGRSMGGSQANPIRVYIDRSEQPFEALRNTLAWDIEEARYLAPSEAVGRYGGRASSGAIVLKLVKVKEKKDSTPPAPKDTLARR